MFQQILDSCKYVTDNANYVSIDFLKLDEVVKSMDLSNNIHWLESSPFGLLDFETSDIVNFLLLYHAIGFSYWGEPKWTVIDGDIELDGAFGMIYVFVKEMKEDKAFLNFSTLEKLSFDNFSKIFKGNIEIPLLKERYDNIIEVSRCVNQKMGGNFYNYIKNITDDEELLKLIILNFDSYEDISDYGNREVYFYKRAQLLTSDILHILEYKKNMSVDYSHLVGCADYKIPQVMRNMGILKYNDSLSCIIDSNKPILKDSKYEVEIRASMLIVIEHIRKKSNGKIRAIDINDYIWLKGQEKRKDDKPYHRTRTTAY